MRYWNSYSYGVYKHNLCLICYIKENHILRWQSIWLIHVHVEPFKKRLGFFFVSPCQWLYQWPLLCPRSVALSSWQSVKSFHRHRRPCVPELWLGLGQEGMGILSAPTLPHILKQRALTCWPSPAGGWKHNRRLIRVSYSPFAASWMTNKNIPSWDWGVSIVQKYRQSGNHNCMLSNTDVASPPPPPHATVSLV